MAGKHTIMEEKDLELIIKYKSIMTLLFIKADFLELDIEENSLYQVFQFEIRKPVHVFGLL